jgi:hypothetical protein
MEGAIRACLLYGYRSNPLGLKLVVSRAEALKDGNFLVTCSVTIPHRGLTFIPGAEGKNEALVRLFVAVEDDQGVLSPVRDMSVPISGSPNAGPDGNEAFHPYEMRLLMTRGRQTLVVGALDDVSCLTSFLTLPCEIGARQTPRDMDH